MCVRGRESEERVAATSVEAEEASAVAPERWNRAPPARHKKSPRKAGPYVYDALNVVLLLDAVLFLKNSFFHTCLDAWLFFTFLPNLT